MFVQSIQYMLDCQLSNTTLSLVHAIRSTQSETMFDKCCELLYFFFLNSTEKAECYICRKVISRCDKFSMKRHYLGCHMEYEKHKNDARQTILDKLKGKVVNTYIQQPSIVNNDNKITQASKVVAIALAKQCRPFSDGCFVKATCQDMLKCFGQSGEDMAQLVGDVPLSTCTMIRRTEEISASILMSLRNRLKECIYYSMSLDESTDLSNTSQVAIFVKTVDDNMTASVHFFGLASMHGHVKGETLYEAVDKKVFSITDKSKIVSICTDGANVMVGKDNGFIGFLIKNNIDVLSFHCIIHQQALFAKHLCMCDVMKVCVKIINKIKGGHNALTNRKFKTFSQEIEANYSDLLIFTEVRWLSRGKCLERFFELRHELLDFLKLDKSPKSKEFVVHLSDSAFIIRLAFLCDICMPNDKSTKPGIAGQK